MFDSSNRLKFDIAEVGVFGCWGTHKSVGRVASAACGAGVTIATIEPLKRETDLEQAYVRAVKCDALAAAILRQYPSYFEAYRVWGEGGDQIDPCPLCRGATVCEICYFKEEWKHIFRRCGPGPGGRLRRLNSLSKICIEEPPPPLEFTPAKLPERSWFGSLKRGAKKVWNIVTGKARKQRKAEELRRRQEKALALARREEQMEDDDEDEFVHDDDDDESSSEEEDAGR